MEDEDVYELVNGICGGARKSEDAVTVKKSFRYRIDDNV